MAALATWAPLLIATPEASKVQIFGTSGEHFQLDGKPYVIRSGELHYPRVPQEYWRDRMKKMRSMGLNTLSTYVFWNLHEPKPGQFDFTGQLDLARFIKTAQEEGLKVILRPGPYICAEWEFGGFPSWLLKMPGLQVRTSDPRFLHAVDSYFKKLGEQVATLLLQRGGPIILVQVENEYGSFGQDRAYMEAIRASLRSAGFDGTLYTSDSVWGRPDAQKELAFGSFADALLAVNFSQTANPAPLIDELKKYRPDTPAMCGEYWAGWFDHLGGTHAAKSASEGAAGLDWLLKNNVSFNLYMFHGGTNFGFMNGANWDKGFYQPDSTNYDYDAPLDEAGRPTAKFYAYRDVIQKNLSVKEDFPPLPAPIKLMAIPPFKFLESAPLVQLLPPPVYSDKPQSMEDLGQAYGYILYHHMMAEPYRGILEIKDVHDYAVVSQGGSHLGILDRRLKQSSLDLRLEAGKPLEILVENMGRINFSPELQGERKGITKSVQTEAGDLRGWNIYTLPFNDLSTLRFGKQAATGPAFYRGFFDLSAVDDTYLETKGWGKGVVFVNGRNLGRHWRIGPQRALYCPASWLKKGRNEVIVFDLDSIGHRQMRGLAAPSYD